VSEPLRNPCVRGPATPILDHAPSHVDSVEILLVGSPEEIVRAEVD
jgi:hypothetical protein